MSIRTRVWSNLKYYDPKEILIRLREVEEKYPLEEFPYEVATLRTRELKRYGESRQCALFSYGMSQALGASVGYAQSEDDDYDFIAYISEQNAFVPVQMKEFVPEEINNESKLQTEIDKLKEKYADAADLCIAFYINRPISIDVRKLDLEGLNIAELWLFGAADPGQLKWRLIGNLIDSPFTCEYEYPTKA